MSRKALKALSDLAAMDVLKAAKRAAKRARTIRWRPRGQTTIIVLLVIIVLLLTDKAVNKAQTITRYREVAVTPQSTPTRTFPPDHPGGTTRVETTYHYKSVLCAEGGKPLPIEKTPPASVGTDGPGGMSGS